MEGNNSSQEQSGEGRGGKLSLGQTIRRARVGFNLSLRRLAGVIGKDPSYLRRIENDEYKRPSPDVLLAVSRELGLDFNHLMSLTQHQVPSHLPSMASFLAQKYNLDDVTARKLAKQFTSAVSDYFASRIEELRSDD